MAEQKSSAVRYMESLLKKQAPDPDQTKKTPAVQYMEGLLEANPPSTAPTPTVPVAEETTGKGFWHHTKSAVVAPAHAVVESVGSTLAVATGAPWYAYFIGSMSDAGHPDTWVTTEAVTHPHMSREDRKMAEELFPQLHRIKGKVRIGVPKDLYLAEQDGTSTPEQRRFYEYYNPEEAVARGEFRSRDKHGQVDMGGTSHPFHLGGVRSDYGATTKVEEGSMDVIYRGRRLPALPPEEAVGEREFKILHKDKTTGEEVEATYDLSKGGALVSKDVAQTGSLVGRQKLPQGVTDFFGLPKGYSYDDLGLHFIEVAKRVRGYNPLPEEGFFAYDKESVPAQATYALTQLLMFRGMAKVGKGIDSTYLAGQFFGQGHDDFLNVVDEYNQLAKASAGGNLPSQYEDRFNTLSRDMAKYDNDADGIISDREKARAAQLVGVMNLPAAWVEKLGNVFALKQLKRSTVGMTVGEWLKKRAMGLVKTTASEVAEEEAEQFWGNLLASDLEGYDSEREITEGMWDTAVVTALTMGLASGGRAGLDYFQGDVGLLLHDLEVALEEDMGRVEAKSHDDTEPTTEDLEIREVNFAKRVNNESGGRIQFAKATTEGEAGQGMGRVALEKAIAKLRKKASANVVVYENVDEIKDPFVRRQVINEMRTGGDVNGLYDTSGTVYLNASNIKTAEEAQGFFRHETYGHFGIDLATGRDTKLSRGFFQYVIDKYKGSKRWQAVEKNYEGASDLTLAMEFVANMSESPHAFKNTTRRDIAAKIRQSLGMKAKEGEGELNDAVLLKSLHLSKRIVETGGALDHRVEFEREKTKGELELMRGILAFDESAGNLTDEERAISEQNVAVLESKLSSLKFAKGKPNSVPEDYEDWEKLSPEQKAALQADAEAYTEAASSQLMSEIMDESAGFDKFIDESKNARLTNRHLSMDAKLEEDALRAESKLTYDEWHGLLSELPMLEIPTENEPQTEWQARVKEIRDKLNRHRLYHSETESGYVRRLDEFSHQKATIDDAREYYQKDLLAIAKNMQELKALRRLDRVRDDVTKEDMEVMEGEMELTEERLADLFAGLNERGQKAYGELKGIVSGDAQPAMKHLLGIWENDPQAMKRDLWRAMHKAGRSISDVRGDLLNAYRRGASPNSALVRLLMEELESLGGDPPSFFSEGRVMFAKRARHGGSSAPHLTGEGFKESYIKSGTGGLAQGWGLYFAEMAGVARHYRNLARRGRKQKVILDGKEINASEFILKKGQLGDDYDPKDEALIRILGLASGQFREGMGSRTEWLSPDTAKKWEITRLNKEIRQYVQEAQLAGNEGKGKLADNFRKRSERAQAELERMEAFDPSRIKVKKSKDPSAFYEVELAPKAHEYLHWDKPLKEQSAFVKKSIRPLVQQVVDWKKAGSLEEGSHTWFGETVKSYMNSTSGSDFYSDLSHTLANIGLIGQGATGYANTEQMKAASKALLAAGVRGNRYWDQDSRGKTGRTVSFEGEPVDGSLELGKVAGAGDVVTASLFDREVTDEDRDQLDSLTDLWVLMNQFPPQKARHEWVKGAKKTLRLEKKSLANSERGLKRLRGTDSEALSMYEENMRDKKDSIKRLQKKVAFINGLDLSKITSKAPKKTHNYVLFDEGDVTITGGETGGVKFAKRAGSATEAFRQGHEAGISESVKPLFEVKGDRIAYTGAISKNHTLKVDRSVKTSVIGKKAFVDVKTIVDYLASRIFHSTPIEIRVTVDNTVSTAHGGMATIGVNKKGTEATVYINSKEFKNIWDINANSANEELIQTLAEELQHIRQNQLDEIPEIDYYREGKVDAIKYAGDRREIEAKFVAAILTEDFIESGTDFLGKGYRGTQWAEYVKGDRLKLNPARFTHGTGGDYADLLRLDQRTPDIKFAKTHDKRKYLERVKDHPDVHPAVKEKLDSLYEIQPQSVLLNKAASYIWEEDEDGKLSSLPYGSFNDLKDALASVGEGEDVIMAAGQLYFLNEGAEIDRIEESEAGKLRVNHPFNTSPTLDRLKKEKGRDLSREELAQAYADHMAIQVDNLSEWSTTLGRAIQVLDALNWLHPAVLHKYFKRNLSERQLEQLKKKGMDGEVDEIDENGNKTGRKIKLNPEALVDEIKLIITSSAENAPKTKGMGKRLDNIIRMMGGERGVLWGQYKKDVAGKVMSKIKQALGGKDTEGKRDPALMEAVNELTGAMKEVVDDLTPDHDEAQAKEMLGKTKVEFLQDMLDNSEKFQEVWQTFGDQLVRKYGSDPEMMGKLQQVFGKITYDRLTNKVIMGVAAESLKTMGEGLSSLIKEHVSKREARIEELAEGVMAQLVTTTKAESIEIAKQLMSHYKALVKEAMVKELNRRAKASNPNAKAAYVKPFHRMIHLINMGALDDADIYNALSQGMGLPQAYDEKFNNHIKKLADKVQTAPEGFQKSDATLELMNAIQGKAGDSLWDLALEIRRAGLLTGFSTQEINAWSTAINFGFSMWNQTYALNLNPLSILNMWGKAMKTMFTDAGTEAVHILRTGKGRTGYAQSKFQADPIIERYFKGWKKFFPYKYAYRALAAVDVLFRMSATEAKWQVLATQAAKGDKVKMKQILKPISTADAKAQARKEGLSPTSLPLSEKSRNYRRRIHEIIMQARADANPEMSDDADYFGASITFQQKPEGVLGWLAEGWNKAAHPAKVAGGKPISGRATARKIIMNVAVPYVNTLVNVANAMIEWSPAAIVSNTWKKRKLSKSAYDDMRYRAYTGTATWMALLYYLLDQDDEEEGALLITGSGETFDHATKRTMQDEAGWRPYTVRIKGTDWEWNYKESIWAAPLLVYGHIKEQQRWGDHDKQIDVVLPAVMAMQQLVFEQTPFKGLDSFFDAIAEPNPNMRAARWKKLVAETITRTAIPNIAYQIDRWTDPTKTGRNELTSGLLEAFPFARRLNSPDLGVFGEPIERTKGDLVADFFDRIVKSPPDPDPMIALMVEKGYLPTPFRKTINLDPYANFKLTNDSRREGVYFLQRVGGREFKRLLDNYGIEKLKALTPEQFEYAIKRRFKPHALHVAKDKLKNLTLEQIKAHNDKVGR